MHTDTHTEGGRRGRGRERERDKEGEGEIGRKRREGTPVSFQGVRFSVRTTACQPLALLLI